MNLKSNYRKFFVLLGVIFIISANLAWLNPQDTNPKIPRLYKTHQTIPLFWQYNLDSGVEILTAAYFPKIYEVNNTRIDRPVYPIIANIFGKTIGMIGSPFIKLNKLEKAGIGYLLLKILIFSSSIILMHRIISHYFDNKISCLSIFFTYTSPFAIFYITAFHTSELQFITPIFIIYFFTIIKDKYSVFRNIIFSILIGILMLAKPNYAVYLTFMFFLIYKKKWVEIFISFFSHLIPIILYLIFINLMNFEFQITGTKDYNQGVWIYNDIRNGNIFEVIKLFIFSFTKFFIAILYNYKIIFLFAIAGILIKSYKKNIKIDHYVFLLLFVFCTYLQMFVADRYNNYMSYDLAIVLNSFAAYGIYELIKKIERINFRGLFIPIIMFLYLAFNIASFIHLPWVHPYNQISKDTKILNNKLNKLDKNIKLN